MAVEEPKYEVLDSFGDIEIRKYGPLVIAETEVTGEFSEAGNEGFKRIASYIFGGNQKQQKINMTAPVLQREEKQKEKRIVAFVMPEGKSLNNLPLPDDAKVVLKEIPPQKMAAFRYSGTWSEERYKEKMGILLQTLQERQFKTRGVPILARYNPPWIPWFLRRNEILIELE